MLIMCTIFRTTVRNPSNQRVGSGPIENINLRIVDATRVLIPDSRGRVKTITAEDSITVHMRPDKCGISSETNNTIQTS